MQLNTHIAAFVHRTASEYVSIRQQGSKQATTLMSQYLQYDANENNDSRLNSVCSKCQIIYLS